MKEYAMVIKRGDGLVFKTKSNSLKEATNYFSKLKQMKKSDFNKIFKVKLIP